MASSSLTSANSSSWKTDLLNLYVRSEKSDEHHRKDHANGQKYNRRSMHCRNFSDTNTASFVSVRRIEQCNVLGVILRSFNKEREAEGEISRRLRSRRTNVSCRYCTKMSNTALKTNPTTKPTTYQCYISLFLEDRRRLTSEKRLNSEVWRELTPGGGFCCCTK